MELEEEQKSMLEEGMDMKNEDFNSKNTLHKYGHNIRPRRRNRKCFLVLAGVLVVCSIILGILVHSVKKLRGTVMTLEQVLLPDLCNNHSMGKAITGFHNPSFCAPIVGPIVVHIETNQTKLLEINIPEFTLASGVSQVQSHIAFDVLASPEILQQTVFQPDKEHEIYVVGNVPVHISCLWVPISMNLDIQDVLPKSNNKDTLVWKPLSSHQHFQNESGLKLNPFAEELDRIIRNIVKTIGLSNIHLDHDNDGLYAFTEVNFEYTDKMKWTIPELNVELNEKNGRKLLYAGSSEFILGKGATTIRAFSELRNADSGRLQDSLQSYLTGNDLDLVLTGSNAFSTCISQRVMNLMKINLHVPGKIDGQPAFLRHYDINPTLKKLDSRTHECILQLDVDLTIFNPLPFNFELNMIQFKVLYANASRHAHQTTSFLGNVNHGKHIKWSAHATNDLSLSIQVTNFSTCQDLIELYLQDSLAFGLHRGNVSISVGGGMFDVPFEVDEIRIHPPSLAVQNSWWMH